MQPLHSCIAALALAALQQSVIQIEIQGLTPPKLCTIEYLSSQIDSIFLAAPSGVAFL